MQHIIFIRERGHSGSKLLAELLMSLGLVVLFEPTVNKCNGLTLSLQLQQASRCQSLDISSVINELCVKKTCNANTSRHVAMIGEGGLIKQLDHKMLTTNTNFVKLLRSNKLKHSLSLMKLWKNHATTPNISVKDPKYVNTSNLLHNLKKIRPKKDLRKYDATIYYEELQNMSSTKFKHFLHRLGVHVNNHAPLKYSMYKSISEDLRYSVINFNEIKENIKFNKCLVDMWTSTVPEIFNCNVTYS